MSSPPKNDAAEEPTSSSDRSKWSPERKTSQHSSSVAGKPKCPEEEEVIHLLAIRSLMDQVYNLAEDSGKILMFYSCMTCLAEVCPA